MYICKKDMVNLEEVAKELSENNSFGVAVVESDKLVFDDIVTKLCKIYSTKMYDAGLKNI